MFILQVRLLTSHIFSLFENTIGPESVITVPIFQICLDAEMIEPTIHMYRNKLQLLEGLEFNAIHSSLLKYPEFSKVR